MNDSADISLTTEEGHAVTLSRRDFDILTRWPRLDMTRLLVVGEDAVHARRTDGTVHPQSLEDFLATVKAPEVLKVPPAPAASEPRPSGLLAHFKQTGNARPSRGALAGKGGVKLPTVYVNGQPVLLTRNTVEAGRVKVAVTAQDSQDVVAWACVPQADFETLRWSPARPDILAWRVGVDGQPITRVKANSTDIQMQAVSGLLAALGRDPAAMLIHPLDVSAS